MPQPKVCVLRAPGTNCDHETVFAFEEAGAIAERVHLFRLLESPALLRDFQILCVPGGFSYGDDVGAGAVFGNHLRTRLHDALHDFLSRETLTLGICNGFQVLLRAGVLPGGAGGWRAVHDSTPEATLTWNANGRYTDLWVTLRVGRTQNAFLKGIETLECPIAHAEGRIAVRDASVLDRWEEAGQVALRYAADANIAADNQMLPYPQNPNGSTANIAGLSDPSGRVLGLMPHPERFLFATQHPQWTRRKLAGAGAGRKVFENGVRWFQ